jgi:hypothetical protein
MPPSTSILSQTLQSITATKIEELEKQRVSYQEEKALILDAANPDKNNLRSRIACLHDGVKRLGLADAIELDAIHRWLGQSKYDPSVPEAALNKFETRLRSILDVHSRKLSLADLYSRLLIEWIESPKTGDDEAPPELDDLPEDFDVVQNIQKERLQQLRERFEKVIFEPLETDAEEIKAYLESLFDGDERAPALDKIRKRVRSKGKELLETKQPFDRDGLKSCIQSLLKNDLLNEEKATSLKEFLRDDTVLDEIRDVLNMRYASLHRWSWTTGSAGMPVLP